MSKRSITVISKGAPMLIPCTCTTKRFFCTSMFAIRQRTPTGTTRSPISIARSRKCSGKRCVVITFGIYGSARSVLKNFVKASSEPVVSYSFSAAKNMVTSCPQLTNAAATPRNQKDAVRVWRDCPTSLPSLSKYCPSLTQTPVCCIS